MKSYNLIELSDTLSARIFGKHPQTGIFTEAEPCKELLTNQKEL